MKTAEVFQSLLENLLDEGVRSVEIAREPRSPGGAGHPVIPHFPYLLACVGGAREYRYWDSGQIRHIVQHRGNCLYCAPDSWISVLRHQAQQAVCLTFSPHGTALMLVEFGAPGDAPDDPPERAITAQSFAPALGNSGLSLCEALELPPPRFAAKFRRDAGEMLLIRALESLQSKPPRIKAEFTYQAARLYVEENCDRPLSREVVAAHLNLSATHVSKLFSQHGEPFSEFLTRVRLERARRLLRQSNLNIAEVARLSGFSDANYFARCFRTRWGQTPSQARAR